MIYYIVFKKIKYISLNASIYNNNCFFNKIIILLDY